MKFCPTFASLLSPDMRTLPPPRHPQDYVKEGEGEASQDGGGSLSAPVDVEMQFELLKQQVKEGFEQITADVAEQIAALGGGGAKPVAAVAGGGKTSTDAITQLEKLLADARQREAAAVKREQAVMKMMAQVCCRLLESNGIASRKP